MGQSTDETDCDPRELKRHRPDNIVPGSEGETNSQLEFSAEGDDVGIRDMARTNDKFSWRQGLT